MQEFNIIYESRTIDLDDYNLPSTLVTRPLTDEYIVAEVKKTLNTKLLRIAKVAHTKKNGVTHLLLVLQQ